MKKYYLIGVLCLFTGTLFAQAHSGYYNNASGKSGNQLKAALNDIIDGHQEYSYSALWDLLKDTDRDPNDPSKVIGIYSGFSMDAAAEYANGNGWNREHVWAKSRGDFGTSTGPGTDLHHIRASDISTNGDRSNRAFDECGIPHVDDAGNYQGATGSYTSNTDYTWEPRAEVKGDVARMIFYMAVRYEGENGEPDLELTEQVLGNTDKQPLHGKLSSLLAWHSEDPVSSTEIQRNNVIYSHQNNRNPFIDHPEYVNLIWGGGTPPPPPTGTDIVISIKTDNYPEETSWTLKNSAGTTVSSGGNYSSAGNIYNTTVSLEDDTYTFTINDTYGDGMCCSYGNGYYQITQGQTVLAHGGQYGSSESKNFTIGDSGGGSPTLPEGYCDSEGNNSSYEYISSVSIGTLINNSGNNGGYGSFTSPSLNLSSGQNVQFTLTPAFPSGSYDEYFRIFIDYNRDGDFNDSGEIVYSSGAVRNSVSGSFTVKSGISTGPAKMRVSMKYNGIAASCEAFSYGEVEDYVVYLGTSSARIVLEKTLVAPDEPVTSLINIYPNPAQDILNIKAKVIEGQAEISLYNVNSACVYRNTITTERGILQHKISLTDIQPGVYIINISTPDGKLINHTLIKK